MRAAVQLFARKGFGNTGVREIADLATMNVASIYHHFSSKEELLFAIVEESFRATYEPARRIVNETPEPARALALVTRHHIEVHCEHAAETIVSDGELGSLSGPGRERALALRDSYEQLWDELLRRGQEQGVFRLDDLELVRIAVLTMCSQVAAWYRPTGRVEVDRIASVYTRLVLRMVAYRPQQPSQ